jgi:homocysteine S-methyltransferase
VAKEHAWSGERAGHRMRDEALVWKKAGARLIGGCCRTTPRDVRDVAEALREKS